MYRFNRYGFIVAQLKDMLYTDSKLGDQSFQILQGPTSAVRECSLPGVWVLVITRMKVE